METAFQEAGEYEEFWNIEELESKPAVALNEPVEYDGSFWNADLDDDEVEDDESLGSYYINEKD